MTSNAPILLQTRSLKVCLSLTFSAVIYLMLDYGFFYIEIGEKLILGYLLIIRVWKTLKIVSKWNVSSVIMHSLGK